MGGGRLEEVEDMADSDMAGSRGGGCGGGGVTCVRVYPRPSAYCITEHSKYITHFGLRRRFLYRVFNLRKNLHPMSRIENNSQPLLPCLLLGLAALFPSKNTTSCECQNSGLNINRANYLEIIWSDTYFLPRGYAHAIIYVYKSNVEVTSRMTRAPGISRGEVGNAKTHHGPT